jgi:hypothetical protein
LLKGTALEAAEKVDALVFRISVGL